MKRIEAGSGTWFRLATAAAAAVIALTACSSTGNNGGSSQAPPPTANMKPQTAIGASEGQLNVIAWNGYADTSWVKPFTAATGCKVNATYPGSSGEMVTLMANGGGGKWDMVSARGDAALSLIYSGDVRPMNPSLITDFGDFQTYFKTPPYNTVGGIHYGISLQWSPNVLLYSTKKYPVKPTSWSVIYDPGNKGLVTVPDNPMQIADAALYLMSTQPKLGIKDPYELTQVQFDASIALLKQQRPLVKKYWALAFDEIQLFLDGKVLVGAATPYQTINLQAAAAQFAETIPTGGATGWGDTWMLATQAPHPNCAYMWTRWVSTPQVQAEQAVFFGETPVNTKACAKMEALQVSSCAQYHVDPPGSYFNNIKFWKTPIATCDDGSKNCIPYSQWVGSWTTVTAA